MKKTAMAAMAALSVVVLATSSSAFAQGKTRAEVYQELIQAEQNGLNYVTDASYPEVSPVFAQQVAQHREALARDAAPTHRVASQDAQAGSVN